MEHRGTDASNPFSLLSVMHQLCILCFQGSTTGFCQLISAGRRTSGTGDAGKLFFYLLNRQTLHQFWDGFQITVASAGKFYVLYDVAVQLHFDQGGAGSLCLVQVTHVCVSSYSVACRLTVCRALDTGGREMMISVMTASAAR